MAFVALLALCPLVAPAPAPHGGSWIPVTPGATTTPGTVNPGGVTITGGTTGGNSGAGPTTGGPGSGGPTTGGPGPSTPVNTGPSSGPILRGTPGVYKGPSGPVRTGGTSAPGVPVGGPAAQGLPMQASAPVATASLPQNFIDLTAWDHWWFHNRHAFLDLRRAVHATSTVTGSDDWFLGHGETYEAGLGLRPTEEQLRGVVVPALLEALRDERSNDVLTGALIALAKIGDGAHQPREGAREDRA